MLPRALEIYNTLEQFTAGELQKSDSSDLHVDLIR